LNFLDHFERVVGDDDLDDPSFSVLSRPRYADLVRRMGLQP